LWGHHDCRCCEAITTVVVRPSRLSLLWGHHACRCCEAITTVVVVRPSRLSLLWGHHDCRRCEAITTVVVVRPSRLSLLWGHHDCRCSRPLPIRTVATTVTTVCHYCARITEHNRILILMLLLITRLQLNPLNAKLNPIYPLLALFGAHHILHVGR